MTAPIGDHYAVNHDGTPFRDADGNPRWVGSTRGELAMLRAKLEIARAALLGIVEGAHVHVSLQSIAANALRRSEP
jgi:hypothetical protein